MKSTTRSKSSLFSLLLAFALVVAACGSDSDDDAGTDSGDDATTTTAAADTEEAPAEEEEEAPADDEAAAAGIPIELGEWFVGDPGSLTAGTFTFDLSNTGENPHALAIVRGTSYEDLPLLENGAVDTDSVGDDYLGTTENIESGSTGTIDFDLEAGDYVFFCPIQFGPNSHAAQGQVLSVTVG